VGERDEMVTARFTEQVLAKARPPNVDLRVLPGLGHLLLHDHLADALPLITGWLGQVLRREPMEVTSKA
jgi:fermentation-respiration switch protein FrsA (DUF1100 family)